MAGVGITGKIKPLNGAPFPVFEDIDGQGGWRSVDDAAARDDIPDNSRKQGMIVVTVDTGEAWQLVGGIDNADWEPFGGDSIVPLTNTYWLNAGTLVAPEDRDGSIANPFATLVEAFAAATANASPAIAFVLTPGDYSGEELTLPLKNLIFWGLGIAVAGGSAYTYLPALRSSNQQGLSFRSCQIDTITCASGTQIDLIFCNVSGIVGETGNVSVNAIGFANGASGNISGLSGLAYLTLTECYYQASFFGPGTQVENVFLTRCTWVSDSESLAGGSFRALDSFFINGIALTGYNSVVLDDVSLSSFTTSGCTAPGASLLSASWAPVFTIAYGANVAANYRLNARYQSITLTGASTIAVTPGIQGQAFLQVIQDATGGRVPTLTGVVWVGGGSPTWDLGANAITLVSLVYDGIRVLASVATTGDSKPLSNTIFVDAGTQVPTAAQDGSIASPFASLTTALTVAGSLSSAAVTLMLTPGNYGFSELTLPNKSLVFDALASTVSGFSGYAFLPPLRSTVAQKLSFRYCTPFSITCVGATQIDLLYCAVGDVTGLADNVTLNAIGFGNGVTDNFGGFTGISKLTLTNYAFQESVSLPTRASVVSITNTFWNSSCVSFASGSFTAIGSAFAPSKTLTSFSSVVLDDVSFTSFTNGGLTAVGAALSSNAFGPVLTIANAASVDANYRTGARSQRITIAQNTAIAVTPGTQGQTFLQIVQGGGGGFTPTLSGVTWVNNAAPVWATAAGAVNLVTLVYDGTTVLASISVAGGGGGAQGAQGSQGSSGGAQGAQGAQGGLGTQGAQGFQGARGFQGFQGFQGNTGAGAQGAQGFQGNTGTQGSQGFQGNTGAGTQGAQGFQGATGTGTQGSQGFQGGTGGTGAQGFQGFQGGLGFQGFQGGPGGAGSQGAQGFQGSSGTGTQGAQGFQGSQGGLGIQGAQGFQGSQGFQGALAGGLGAFVGAPVDGDLSLSSGTTTLTSDKHYGTLTLTGTAIINTNGYRVSALIIDLRNTTQVGAIRFNGNPGGTPASGSSAGNDGGAALAIGNVGGSTIGGYGGDPSNTAGQTQTNVPGNGLNAVGGAGGNSGTGGTGAGGAGGVAGSGGTVSGGRVPLEWTHELIQLTGASSFSMITGGAGGAGGSSGGGGGNFGGTGGGGGSGGGVQWLCFGEVLTSVTTVAGAIQARGGDGGNAALPLSGTNHGGSCGGAGGGGGFVFMAVGRVTGPAVASLVDANGGLAGTNSANSGTGTAATASVGGQGGRVSLLYLLGRRAYAIGPVNAIGTAGGLSALDLDPALAVP